MTSCSSPPRDPQAPLFAGRTLLLALLQGLGVLAVVLGAQLWGAGHLGEDQARALAFTTLVLGNLALIFSNRAGPQRSSGLRSRCPTACCGGSAA